jgi:chloramphenicol 3-O-phosphotransferase|tara:strand:+ start:691 stop:1002 length:312 start_codon:yes stop_codon:yes gene_type:complete
MNFLFILTLKSILSSVIGSSFYKWFQTTTLGIWFQFKLDSFMEYLSDKYDIELAKKQSKFEADYPLIMKRIEKLEKLSHPDRQEAFNKVIDELEKKIDENKKL